VFKASRVENMNKCWMNVGRHSSVCACVSVSVSLCLCVSVSLCLCVSVSLCLCVSVSLGLWVSGSLGLCVSVSLCLCVSGSLGLWVSGSLGLCVSVSLCLCVSVSVSVSMCLCVSVSLFLSLSLSLSLSTYASASGQPCRDELTKQTEQHIRAKRQSSNSKPEQKTTSNFMRIATASNVMPRQSAKSLQRLLCLSTAHTAAQDCQKFATSAV
jgi:hypothetical protein